MVKEAIKIVANNKKARFDYFIEEAYEAGIELVGTEVKSIRQGKINIRESYAAIRGGEVFVFQMHISPYEMGNIHNKDPLRVRKLLLHKSEIRKLIGYTQQQGYALIPLKMYLKRGLVKVTLAVARGKKLYDKRQDLATKDAKREVERAFKERNKE